MKKHTLKAALLISLINIIACQNGNQNAITHRNSNGQAASTITVNDGQTSMEIKYAGDIKLNNDETAIESISSEGFVQYRKNDKKLFAESNDKGEIVYEMHQGSRKLRMDDEGKKFLAEALRDMTANGFDQSGRMERLYNSGGVDAVLNESGNLQSNHVKATYLEYLLSKADLTAEQLSAIAQEISTFTDDNLKRKLVEKAAPQMLKDEISSKAFFATIESISSNTEKANALKAVAQHKLSPAQFEQAMNATSTINSNYEMEGALRKFVESAPTSDAQWISIINTAGKLTSDVEKGSIMKYIGEKMPNSPAVKVAYTDVITTRK